LKNNPKSKKRACMTTFFKACEISGLETQILISNRLGYLNHEECDVMISRLNEISRMLQGMIKRISLLNQ